MNKIIIIGCPGSGKSYLSRQLHKILNIPVYHLDKIYWLRDWNHLEHDEFVKKIKDIIDNNDKYIIDGNYINSLKMRMDSADTIIYLDMDTTYCLENVHKRSGTLREDFPEYLIDDEVVDQEFIDYIINFNQNNRELILSLIKENSNKEIITIHNKLELEKFIKNLKEDNYEK